MSRWKERIDKILNTERKRIVEALKEANGNYRDTGWNRYYKRIQKLEAELEELDRIPDSLMLIADAESRARRYRKAILSFRDKMDSYLLDHRAVERPIEETIGEMKRRLVLACEENGVRI